MKRFTAGVEIRVKLESNFVSDASIREAWRRYTPDRGYRWRELELVLGDDYDVLVALNHPRHSSYDRSRTIVFECEPAFERARYEPFLPRPEEGVAHFDVVHHHAFLGWYVDRFRDELAPQPVKERTLSAVVSDTAHTARHVRRLAFVTEHLAQLPELDHYGRGSLSGPSFRGAIGDKALGLLPYRYTFNAENAREPNFFTEKILDPVVCETLCFYDGCPNLDAFLDPACWIEVDLDRPEESLEVVRAALAADEWGRRLPAIRAQKAKLLDDLNPLEIVRRVVRGDPIRWRDSPRAPHGTVPTPEGGLPPAVVIGDPVDGSRAAATADHLRGLGLRSELVLDRSPARGHAAALERVRASGLPGVLVVEDDVRLAPDAAQLLAALGTVLRPADVVVLGGAAPFPFRHGRHVSLPGKQALVDVHPLRLPGGYAYLATPLAARAMLAARRRGEALPSDVTLGALDPGGVAWKPGPLMEPERDRVELARAAARPIPESWSAGGIASRLAGRAATLERMRPRRARLFGAAASVLEVSARARSALHLPRLHP